MMKKEKKKERKWEQKEINKIGGGGNGKEDKPVSTADVQCDSLNY